MNGISKWIRRTVVAGAALASCATLAEDGSWRFTIGGSYRLIDDIEFGGVNLPGSGTSDSPGGPYGVQDLAATQLGLVPLSTVTVDVLDYSGRDVEIENGSLWAPIIGVEYTLSSDNEGDCSWVFTGNFQYYGVEADESSASGVTGESRNYNVLTTKGDPTIVAPHIANSEGAVSASTSVLLNEDFDMDLYVFDVGLKGTHKVNGITLGVAAGPTINVSDVETSQSAKITTAAIPNTVKNGSAVPNASDDDLNIALGLYLGLSASVDLSDEVALGVGYRYDWVSEDAGTSQAEVDLSSSSLLISLQVKF